jgi:hypothetical protein
VDPLRRTAAALAVAALAGTAAASLAAPVADAGQPKVSAVLDLSVGRDHHVTVRLSAADGQRYTLAQIRAQPTVPVRRCHRDRTTRRMIVVSRQLGLAQATRIAPDPQLGDGAEQSVYLYQPDTRQPYSAGARSLAYRLVELGYATVGPEHGTFRPALLRAQRHAQRAHRGRWRRCG